MLDVDSTLILYLISLLPSLASILALVLQWIGVIKLGNFGRRSEWWLMLGGTIISTLNLVLLTASYLQIPVHIGGRSAYTIINIIMQTSRFLNAIGLALFFLGFIIHCVRISKYRTRLKELEMMNLAQATELNNLRRH